MPPRCCSQRPCPGEGLRYSAAQPALVHPRLMASRIHGARGTAHVHVTCTCTTGEARPTLLGELGRVALPKNGGSPIVLLLADQALASVTNNAITTTIVLADARNQSSINPNQSPVRLNTPNRRAARVRKHENTWVSVEGCARRGSECVKHVVTCEYLGTGPGWAWRLRLDPKPPPATGMGQRYA